MIIVHLCWCFAVKISFFVDFLKLKRFNSGCTGEF